MIDSHCHLAGDEFEADLDATIERARAAGVESTLVILSAGDDAEAARARTVQSKWPGVRFATGVHPHNAGTFADNPAASTDVTRRHAAAFAAVGIGEIGLDYHYDFAPRDVQQKVFAAQLALSRELGRPVIIHTREATDDTFALIAEAGDLRGVFHCFTGDAAMARRAVDIGFYVSFSGIVTFPKADSLREAARVVPGDRLLIETDSPYLAPVPHRGTRNEPALVARVLEALAEARGESAADLERRTNDNFASLFAST